MNYVLVELNDGSAIVALRQELIMNTGYGDKIEYTYYKKMATFASPYAAVEFMNHITRQGEN